MTYPAEDSLFTPEAVKYLEQIQAPKTLRLRIGAPVILIKNLNENLVNGLLGTVRFLDENTLQVHFEEKGIVTLKKTSFSGK